MTSLYGFVVILVVIIVVIKILLKQVAFVSKLNDWAVGA